MSDPQHERQCILFADVLLKLNCYHDLTVNHGDDRLKNPEPHTLVAWLTEALNSRRLYILIDDGTSLITASGGDIRLTLYNLSPALMELVRQLAIAAGLFIWQP